MAPSKRNTENHTHSFDVIHLPGNVACPKEIAEANLPNGDVKQVLLLYDTGATMTTGTQDVTPLDQRHRPAITGPVITTGVNSKLYYKLRPRGGMVRRRRRMPPHTGTRQLSRPEQNGAAPRGGLYALGERA